MISSKPRFENRATYSSSHDEPEAKELPQNVKRWEKPKNRSIKRLDLDLTPRILICIFIINMGDLSFIWQQ